MAMTGTVKKHRNQTFQVGEINVGTEATNYTLTGTEVALFDGVVAGTASASKALVLDSSGEIDSITTLGATTLTGTTVTGTTVTGTTVNAGAGGLSVPITILTTVDSSAGGVAQETNCALIPADSILLNVTAVVAAAMNGDTTKTLEVGVTGNIDAYIDSTDFDPSAAADTYASSLNGTTNDVVTPQWLAAETQLIATWTNTASASAGSTLVYVTYIPLA